jgi:hypothetical protein
MAIIKMRRRSEIIKKRRKTTQMGVTTTKKSKTVKVSPAPPEPEQIITTTVIGATAEDLDTDPSNKDIGFKDSVKTLHPKSTSKIARADSKTASVSFEPEPDYMKQLAYPPSRNSVCLPPTDDILFGIKSLTAVTPDDFLGQFNTVLMDRLPQYYRDDKLNESTGIRDEYSQKVVQFGYVAMFSCCFPLAPVFALINNIYELRADAYKLLVVYQRPVPFRAQNIGVWEQILRFVAACSVATNSVLIALNSPAFHYMFLSKLDEGSKIAVRLGFILAFHYGVYIMALGVFLVVPEVPKSVELSIARATYLDKLHRNEVLEEEDEQMSCSSLSTEQNKNDAAETQYTV